jgi:predicted nucleotidyltransferase
MITREEKQVLSDLVSIIREVELPMMLVGAGARLLIFDSEFGEGRSTTDWDVAISLDSWDAYEKFCNVLVQGDSPYFAPTKNVSHRFRHIATNIDVDIIPFGKIGEPDQQIVWADSENSMNILGFVEALLHAETINIDDLEIQVLGIPALVVLKIFAWGDRGQYRENKDLEDIEFILSKYEDEERAYTELSNELSDGTVDLLYVSIYLLGQDIYKIFSAKTLAELTSWLNRLIEQFGADEARSLGSRLKALQKGINSASPL